jgi:hypothetical protein
MMCVYIYIYIVNIFCVCIYFAFVFSWNAVQYVRVAMLRYAHAFSCILHTYIVCECIRSIYSVF